MLKWISASTLKILYDSFFSPSLFHKPSLPLTIKSSSTFKLSTLEPSLGSSIRSLFCFIEHQTEGEFIFRTFFLLFHFISSSAKQKSFSRLIIAEELDEISFQICGYEKRKNPLQQRNFISAALFTFLAAQFFSYIDQDFNDLFKYLAC